MYKKIRFSSCQGKPSRFNLLATKINFKKDCLKTLKNEFDLLHNELRNVCSFLLSSNDAISKAHYSVQQKGLNLLFKNHQPKLEPDRIIFNYLNASVSDAENWFLVKGLCFSLSPEKLNYADYLTSF